MNLITNFIKAGTNYIKEGMPNVSREEYNQRLDICKQCEFFNKATVQCNQCGCFLLIKAKWATENCPENKWPAVENSVTENSPPIAVSGNFEKQPCLPCQKAKEMNNANNSA